MKSLIIYHNPRCSKSRQTLAILQEKGFEPSIVEYLKNPPSAVEIKKIAKLLNLTARELCRKSEAIYKELNLSDAKLSEDNIIDAMHKNPKLIERPIVVVDNSKAAIGRPPESVLEIL